MAAEPICIGVSDAEIVAFLAKFESIAAASARFGTPKSALAYLIPGGKLGVPRASVSGTILALREAAAPEGDGLPDLLFTSIRTRLAAARAVDCEPSLDSARAASAL